MYNQLTIKNDFMDLDYFHKTFQAILCELLEKGDIADRNLTSVSTLSTLSFPSWTFLMNVAMYRLIERYNDELEDSLRPNSEFLILIPEDNSGKKGGFADFTIASDNGRIKWFEVEHENDADRLLEGYEKLTRSPARTKVLIGYENRKTDKYRILKQLKDKKEELKTTVCVNLMIAPEQFDWENVNYEVVPI